MWKWLNSDTSGCIIKNNFKMENACTYNKKNKISMDNFEHQRKMTMK